MASNDFVEEFDSDDDEPTSSTSIVQAFTPPVWGQQNRFITQHGTPTSAFSSSFYPPCFQGSRLSLASLSPTMPVSGFSYQLPLLPIISNVYSCQNDQQQQPVIKRKRRRKRKHSIKLADFSNSFKTQVWQKFQLLSLQSKLDTLTSSDRAETHQQRIEITQAMETIRKLIIPPSASTLPSPSTSEDDSNVRKLIKKFKAQVAKRSREKRAKSDKKSNTRRKCQEIDKWQREQRNIYDKQREHQLIVDKAKISFTEVSKKKQILQDKLVLISSLEKLREVRRKQLINVKAGFYSDSGKATRDFQDGISSLRKQVEVALQSVTTEENMITLMIQPQGLGSIEKSKKQERNVEEMRNKRESKWQKYLYKKHLQMQGFIV